MPRDFRQLRGRRPPGPPRRLWGFTLLELLAAASAVSLSLAVAGAVVGDTRGRDKLSGCLANLRLLGQASRAYAAEDAHEFIIPIPNLDVLPIASGAYEWGGKAGVGQSTEPGNPTYSVFGTRNFRGPGHRPLNRYLYKGGIVDHNPIGGQPDPGPGSIHYLNDTQVPFDAYRCPADTGYAGGGYLYTAGSTSDRNEIPFRDEGRTAFDHYGTSYVANVSWIVGGLGGSNLRSVTAWFHPLSQVPYPAASIIYQEVPSRWLWIWGNWSGSNCDWLDYPSRVQGNYSTVPGWHGRDFHTTVAFADGHAALVKMQGCLRPAPNLGPPNYGPGECGSSVDPYSCEACIEFRGSDWQLDVLPAPLAPTPWNAEKSAVRSAGLQVIP
jgi:type II secretory pathway pseudopilin PulG